MTKSSCHGVGVNLTPDYYASVSSQGGVAVDFLEIDPTTFNFTPEVSKRLVALNQDLPFVLHTTGMSICGDNQFPLEDVEQVREAIDLLGASVYSDHLSFTWAQDVNLDLYMAPTYCSEMLDWTQRRCEELGELVGLPVITENVGMIFPQRDAELSEEDFLQRLSNRGIPIQMNLDSIAVSAVTLGLDPLGYTRRLAGIPAETLAVVPERSMNSELAKRYGSSIDELTLNMLEEFLKINEVKRIVVQRRAGDDSTGFADFVAQVKQVYSSAREA